MGVVTPETNIMYVNYISILRNGKVRGKGGLKKFTTELNLTFLKGTFFSYFSRSNK